MRRSARIILLGAVLGMTLVQLQANPAAGTGAVTLEATFSAPLPNGWERVERYAVGSSNFLTESYPPDGRGDQTGQTRTYFGGVAQPHSSRFLLYHAPNWQTNTKSVPVLLVHGANDTADRGWANPGETGSFGCGETTCPSTGLMQYLDARNYRVFAIGFPHRNGDNYYWAEQIYDAIQIIKSKTGATQVDLVGWSKGSMASRMYVSSLNKSWGTDYAGDVRKLVLVGGPNKGFDWGYRHGISHDISVFPECGGALNAPAPHTDFVCYGIWRSHPELSYEGSNFPGSGQMLYRWDSVYPLPSGEQDWYTTYYGGTGFYSKGKGIQFIIDRDSLIQPLISAGVPSSVPVYQLCGNAADIPGVHNEHTGISDGALFVASCNATDGIPNRVATTTLLLNHLELGWKTSAMGQIVTWLN